MNADLPPIPPGHIWIEVYDFPSALQALELLIEYILLSNTSQYPNDGDNV